MNPFETSALNPDANDSPPPPAYSEREFDQKVSRALALSHEIAQAPTDTEDRWEEYDEAAFESTWAAAAAAQSDPCNGGAHATEQQGQSSSSAHNRDPPNPPPLTQPLRISKKAKFLQDSMPKKDEPKWLAIAKDSAASSSGSSQTGLSNAQGDAWEGDDLAPPPFTETTPQPSHREVAVHPPDRSQSSSLPAGPITPNPDAYWPPPPLASLSNTTQGIEPQPSYIPNEVNHTPHPEPAPSPYRQSMPASPSNLNAYNHVPRRPRSAISPSSTQFSASPSAYQNKPLFPGPMLSFNPSVAYGNSTARRSQPPPVDAQDQSPEVFRASAFYNAAVVSYLPPTTPQRTTHKTNFANQTYSSYAPQSPQPHSRYSEQARLGTSNISSMDSYSPQAVQSPYVQQPWTPQRNRPLSTFSTDTMYSSPNVPYAPQYSSPPRPPQPNEWDATPDRRFMNQYR